MAMENRLNPLFTLNQQLAHQLSKQALWLVMHPAKSLDWETDQLFPWVRAEMIRMSEKIAWYLDGVTHRAISVADWCTPLKEFSHWNNFSEQEHLIAYCNEHEIREIVYCGFHHGVCMLSDTAVGMRTIGSLGKYQLYLKHDLSMIGPKGTWKDADEQTKPLARII